MKRESDHRSSNGAAGVPWLCERVRSDLDDLFDCSNESLRNWQHEGVLQPECVEHLRCCVPCRSHLLHLERLAEAIGSLSEERCPDSVIERVLAETVGGSRVGGTVVAERTPPSSSSPRVRWKVPGGEPSLWLAAAGLMATVAVGWLVAGRLDLERRHPVRPATIASSTDDSGVEGLSAELLEELSAAGYSEADLERAEQEARLALSLLGAVSQRTTDAVGSVLRRRVADQPRRTLEKILGDEGGALDA